MLIQICVGSSCHLKGTEQIISLFQQALKEYALEEEVTLAGSFCTGRCNRTGVTVTVDDTVYPGITPESFPAFFEERIAQPLGARKGC